MGDMLLEPTKPAGSSTPLEFNSEDRALLKQNAAMFHLYVNYTDSLTHQRFYNVYCFKRNGGFDTPFIPGSIMPFASCTS
jgi:hypothetical protein